MANFTITKNHQFFRVSTCGSTVSSNCTYIQNPSYPTTYTTAGSCAYSVSPVSSEICQLRLDFQNFDITDVVTTGLCTDSFSISSPSGQNPLDLCGTLTDQHSKLWNISTFKNNICGHLLTLPRCKLLCAKNGGHGCQLRLIISTH